jgi:hypothetical protein
MKIDKELFVKGLKLLPGALAETALHMGLTIAKQEVSANTTEFWNYVKAKKAQK